MGHVVTVEKWIEAVLKHAPTTRHLHITVKDADGSIRLEGRVPTLEDRTMAGFLARSVTPPGLGLDNRLRVEDDVGLDQRWVSKKCQDQPQTQGHALAA